MIDKLKEDRSIPAWVLLLFFTGSVGTTGLTGTLVKDGVSDSVARAIEERCQKTTAHVLTIADARYASIIALQQVEGQLLQVNIRLDAMKEQQSLFGNQLLALQQQATQYQQDMSRMVGDIREMVPLLQREKNP
jgi:TolA-binding protein